MDSHVLGIYALGDDEEVPTAVLHEELQTSYTC